MAAGEVTVSLMVEMQSSPSGPKIAIGAPAAEGVACVADLVLNVGESCSGAVDVFGTEYTGVFQVEETQACVVVASLPPFCDAEKVDPLSLGLLVAEKQSDNTWKITKFGD